MPDIPSRSLPQNFLHGVTNHVDRIVDDHWNYGRLVNGGKYKNTETILEKLQGRLFPKVGFLI